MRYFFHLGGAVHHRDEEGCDLTGPEEARREAVRSAGEYLRDQPEVVLRGDEFRVETTDAAGRVVLAFVAIGVDTRHQINRYGTNHLTS